jgi:predicted dehydrogenase
MDFGGGGILLSANGLHAFHQVRWAIGSVKREKMYKNRTKLLKQLPVFPKQ